MSDLARKQLEARVACDDCSLCVLEPRCYDTEKSVDKDIATQLLATMTALEAAEADRDWLASSAADLDSMLAGERKRWDGPAFIAKTTQAEWLQAARQARESEPTDERGDG